MPRKTAPRLPREQLAVKLPGEQVVALRALATADDVPVAQLVRRAVGEWLGRHQMLSAKHRATFARGALAAEQPEVRS